MEAKTEAVGDDKSAPDSSRQDKTVSSEDDNQEQAHANPVHQSARGYSKEDVDKIQTGEIFFAVA